MKKPALGGLIGGGAMLWLFGKITIQDCPPLIEEVQRIARATTLVALPLIISSTGNVLQIVDGILTAT